MSFVKDLIREGLPIVLCSYSLLIVHVEYQHRPLSFNCERGSQTDVLARTADLNLPGSRLSSVIVYPRVVKGQFRRRQFEGDRFPLAGSKGNPLKPFQLIDRYLY